MLQHALLEYRPCTLPLVATGTNGDKQRGTRTPPPTDTHPHTARETQTQRHTHSKRDKDPDTGTQSCHPAQVAWRYMRFSLAYLYRFGSLLFCGKLKHNAQCLEFGKVVGYNTTTLGLHLPADQQVCLPFSLHLMFSGAVLLPPLPLSCASAPSLLLPRQRQRQRQGKAKAKAKPQEAPQLMPMKFVKKIKK